jgi:hypothetical protein
MNFTDAVLMGIGFAIGSKVVQGVCGAVAGVVIYLGDKHAKGGE